ncbi:M24 family metallopeptidase [Pseudalkalibacillus caeni]|uniref:Aminopeptidase P family protein n=1 Tax=Exobacillus caeni TaxID=2574798 RepID=A0A5R9EYI1_9BACL|nr:Xaa-Pro peptidase family protein [Pseudalkalibacillus caeni]TLS36362.1 aminopeptidase P family protein [Pseudalkalibacillus caeni]
MERIERLREKFKENEMDGMLITSAYNRRYMTRFTGSAGVVVISKKGAKFITDFRYVDQAGEQAKGYEVVQHTASIIDEVAKAVSELGIKKLGFEQDHLTYSVFKLYEDKIDATLVPVSGVIEKLRMIKDSSELQTLKEATEIADAAFEHILTYIRPGLKEIDVSNELEFFMRKNGATSSSFDIIVASGVRSALPHGVASDKIIEKNELVTLDFGAYYKGYCSDITRTVAVGGDPGDELRNIYNIVLDSQLKALEQIKPGMTGKDADTVSRDIIADKGFGDYFGHSLGHGIGLEVHEGPGLSFRSDVVLEPGMVVTVEPGIYLSGKGGVRIEDDTVITESGNEKLSHTTKELLIIGE